MKKIRFNRKRVMYYMIKLAKQSGTPECIAKGVMLGLLIGFMIPFGLQIIIVLPLAFAFKANKIVSCAFTLVTNQLTIFVIYPFQCWYASYLMHWLAKDSFKQLSYNTLKTIFKKFIAAPSFSALAELGNDIMVPFLVGGALLGIVSAVIGYFAALSVVRGIRERRERKIMARRASGQTTVV